MALRTTPENLADPDVTPGAAPEAETPPTDTTLERLKKLPPSVGAALIVAGVVIMPLPGPFGTPLVLAGCLTLAPRTFGKLNDYSHKWFPKARSQANQILDRFLDDMEKRYPSK